MLQPEIGFENGMVDQSQKSFWLVGIAVCTIAMTTGCMDGPFYAMKRINPYYRAQWRADRKLGPTFEDRLDEILLVEKQLPKMSPSEQGEWVTKLNEIIREDSSPEMRARATRAIALANSPTVDQALNAASSDEVEKVRLAACKAWAVRGGKPARDMLMSLAQADESNSVRQSAIDGLAKFDDPEVVKSLAILLDDSSPAVQSSVVGSLASITGEQYGGDIDQWRTYVGNLNMPSYNGFGDGTRILPASGANALPLPRQ